MKAVPLFVISEVKGVQADIQLQVQLWQIQLDWTKLLTQFPGYLFVVIIKNLLQTPMYYIISSILSVWAAILMYKYWWANCHKHWVFLFALKLQQSTAFYFSLPVLRHNQCLCCVQQKQLFSSGLLKLPILFCYFIFCRIDGWKLDNNSVFTHCCFLSASPIFFIVITF